MPKVVLQGYIIVPENSLEQVEEALTHHIELTRKESGNLIFKVTADENNRCRFNVYEEFTSRESFSSHQDRVGKSKWGAVAVNVERHYEIIDLE